MSFKNEHCIASAYTSAGAFIVSTVPAALVGVQALGSAAATTITIKDGVTTAGRTICTIPVAITAAVNVMFPIPIACTQGIVATNAGTLAGYVVLYAK